MNKNKAIIPKIDYYNACDEITRFIRETVEGAESLGVVVGLSGGVDSSLVATLCVRALDNSKVLGILMPTDFTPKQDMGDAMELGKWLRIRTELVKIQSIYETFSKALKCDLYGIDQRMPMANVVARIRMTILYYYANLNRYLVVGTSDRSESLIGYFTKYGDGGADFFPIKHLYKTQVRDLAKHLGIPKSIVYKPSSPQLYPGHKAMDEIPVDYDILDPILVGLFDQKLSIEESSLATGVPINTVKEIQLRFIKSKHKRIYPPELPCQNHVAIRK